MSVMGIDPLDVIALQERNQHALPVIELPLVRGCIERWNQGRRRYGGDGFRGDPLLELYEELVDGINYCDQAELHGHRLGDVRAALMQAAERVRTVYLSCLEERR
jgi:hypothetical protein